MSLDSEREVYGLTNKKQQVTPEKIERPQHKPIHQPDPKHNPRDIYPIEEVESSKFIEPPVDQKKP